MRGNILCRLFVLLVFALPAFAGDERVEFDLRLDRVISAINRETASDPEGPSRLAGLIESDYGFRKDEIGWAVRQSLTWGEIAVLAYIRATNGRTFADLIEEGAQRDPLSYAERAGMSQEKMTISLETLLKSAEIERNSRIFERLRSSRRVYPLPDLGSGFGLFQEALDFRRIDSPRLTKVHSDPLGRGKGEK